MRHPVRIESRQHPFVQRCRRLAQDTEPGEVLLDGPHLVEEALTLGVRVSGLLVDERGEAIARRAAALDVPVYEAGRELLNAVSPARSSTGVVGVAHWQPAECGALFESDAPLVVGLAGVQDPGNVGGIIRSADALGATGVAVLEGSAHPGGWKALRGSMGSAFRLPVAMARTEEVVVVARQRGATIAAMVPEGGTPIDSADLSRPLLVLVGGEGAGLPPEVERAADLRLTIPMRAGVNSLNVGVSAALVLWAAGQARAAARGAR